MSLIIAGSTSGTITLDTPAVAGTQTATLPSATGTVMVSGNMPAFSVYQSGTQTLSSGVFTKLQLNVKVFDTATAFDATTNYRFTPLVAGYYQINGSAQYNALANCLVSIYKNGSEFNRGQQTTSYQTIVSSLIYLNGSTDYLELYGYISGGSTIVNNSTATYFNGSMVRSA